MLSCRIAVLAWSAEDIMSLLLTGAVQDCSWRRCCPVSASIECVGWWHQRFHGCGSSGPLLLSTGGSNQFTRCRATSSAPRVLKKPLLLQGFVSCLHYSGRKSVFLIRINGHLVQCRPLVHSLEALYTQHARSKPFVFLVRPT